MNRREVLRKFKAHQQEPDTRDMDALCADPDAEFVLQAQQKFLREYVAGNKSWKNILLYHLAGSGKTCSAITMAIEYLETFPKNRVVVVLPARLRSNFIDELVSPCGMERFISRSDFERYHDPNVSEYAKKKIRKTFMAEIGKTFELLSFEQFRKTAKGMRLKRWARDFTRNTLLVVDEVHNLISNKYRQEDYMGMVRDNMVSGNKRGVMAMLFRFLNEHADASCKMIYLTASPIFDNLGQLRELVRLMSPDEGDLPPKSKVSAAIERLRGRVSYFPGSSPNAFPEQETFVHEVMVTPPLEEAALRFQQRVGKATETGVEKDQEIGDSFLIRERQALVSVVAFDHERMKRGTYDDVKELAPKIDAMLDVIKGSIGKSVVYSTFLAHGIKVAEHALRLKGWRKFGEDGAMPYMTYCVWDGDVKDEQKEALKMALNTKNNMTGKNIKIVLGSPSIKEGVSFKHVQHLHVLDPVWNGSAKMQLEARAIRFCSHADIPAGGYEGLVRKVSIHYYKAVPMPDGEIMQTADERIYDTIIPAKEALVRIGENALKKVAIDYYLFRKMYMKALSPEKKFAGPMSPIALKEDTVIKAKKKAKTKNTGGLKS